LDIWNFLGNLAQILALPLAIIVVVWQVRKGRQRRAISCAFFVAWPIEIRAGEALKGDIEIRYRGKAVENLFIVLTRLKNTGNLPIRKSDVVEPITFSFAEDAEFIHQPNIANSKPWNLNVDWGYDVTGSPPVVRSISLIPDLLNADDEMDIEFLCTGKGQIPIVSARIEGLSKIDVIDLDDLPPQAARRSRTMAVAMFSMLLVVSALGTIGMASGAIPTPNLVKLVAVVFVLISSAVALMYFAAVTVLRRPKQKREGG
jgi:hypothetical protein